MSHIDEKMDEIMARLNDVLRDYSTLIYGTAIEHAAKIAEANNDPMSAIEIRELRK